MLISNQLYKNTRVHCGFFSLVVNIVIKVVIHDCDLGLFMPRSFVDYECIVESIFILAWYCHTNKGQGHTYDLGLFMSRSYVDYGCIVESIHMNVTLVCSCQGHMLITGVLWREFSFLLDIVKVKVTHTWMWPWSVYVKVIYWLRVHCGKKSFFKYMFCKVKKVKVKQICCLSRCIVNVKVVCWNAAYLKKN